MEANEEIILYLKKNMSMETFLFLTLECEYHARRPSWQQKNAKEYDHRDIFILYTGTRISRMQMKSAAGECKLFNMYIFLPSE